MRSGKPAVRVYGQVETASSQVLQALQAALPDESGRISGNCLDIDFEGLYFDPDDFLAAAARLLAPGDSGNLDLFDDEERRLDRYELAPGGHSLKSYRYDDILEHTKGDGNW